MSYYNQEELIELENKVTDLTEQVKQLREALETIYVSIDDDLKCCLDEERLISIGRLLDVAK